MADVKGLFDRLNTFADYQRAEEEFQAQKQLLALKTAGLARGTDLPATMQIANAIGRARASGDTQGLNDLIMAGKLLDKGVLMGGEMPFSQSPADIPQMPIPSNIDNIGQDIDPSLSADFSNDQVAQLEKAVAQTPAGKAGLTVSVPPTPLGGYRPMPMPGYGEAVGSIAADKKRMETQAQKDVELGMNPRIEQATKEAGAIGARAGENKVNFGEMTARMPQLEDTVSRLSKLGQIATYTAAGQVKNAAMRELGMDVPNGAVAREEYISMVNNEILPLLRLTFGAQFTVKEGDDLKATLGDRNKSPAEKDAILRSFIRTKLETVNSLAREIGTEEPYSPERIQSSQEAIGPKIQMPKGGVGEIEFKLQKSGFTPEQIKEYKKARGIQ